MWVTSFDFHFNIWSFLPSLVLNSSSEVFYSLKCFLTCLLSENAVVFLLVCNEITFGCNFSFVDPKILLYQIRDLMEALVF